MPPGDRFGMIDPLKAEVPLLIHLAEKTEQTYKSLSRDNRLQYLRDLRYANVAGYIRDNLERPERLTLYAVYEAYLHSIWDQLAYYVRTENPHFFAEAGTPPADFAAFLTPRLAALAQQYEDRPLASTLRRLNEWLPTNRNQRFVWVEELDESEQDASALSDLVLGHDVVRGLRREVAAEARNDRSPLGVGMHRERLYSKYAHLAALWRVLKPKEKETLIDLGAGHGRVGMSLRANGYGTRFIGFELLASRVAEAEEVARTLGFRPADWRVERTDLTSPQFDIPKAEYYYIANPMLPSEVDQLMEKLAAKAHAGDEFKVIFAYLPLFAEARELWPEEYGDWATLYARLPRGLEFGKRVSSPEVDFFILHSRRH